MYLQDSTDRSVRPPLLDEDIAAVDARLSPQLEMGKVLGLLLAFP